MIRSQNAKYPAISSGTAMQPRRYNTRRSTRAVARGRATAD